jgi:hypothetical protein
MTKPMKYIESRIALGKSYSHEYTSMWSREIPLSTERNEFLKVDSIRRHEVIRVYNEIYRESIDVLSVPWGC